MSEQNAPRLPDWQMRWHAYVIERQQMPFKWGSNDCALFAAGAVQAITGLDYAAGLRGTYQDAAGAVQTVRQLGGLGEIANDALGASISPAFAQPGDVVLIEIDGRPSLGICNGMTVLGPGPLGIVAVSFEDAQAAWRVG